MRDVQLQSLTLEGLLADLKRGRFVVPNFQRDVEWEAEDIRQLMRSIFNDFFIGTLLLWRPDGDWDQMLECEPISGFQRPSIETPSSDIENNQAPLNTGTSVIVLDGQQRLTAMYYAFFGHSEPDSKLGREWFFIDIEKFESSEEDDRGRNSAFSRRPERSADMEWFAELAEYDPIQTGRPDGDPFPYDETQRHSFPLRLLGTDHAERWLQKYMDFWATKARKHHEQATYHKSRSEEFLARAESVDSTVRPTYQPQPDDRSLQALKQKAQDADDLVSQGQGDLESLLEKRRRLQVELKQSTHTGRNRETGQKQAKVLTQIARARQRLQELKNEASAAQEAVETARQELDRLAEAGQRHTNGTANRESVDGLLQAAAEAEQRKGNHEERAVEAGQSVEFGQSFQRRVQALRGLFTVPAFYINAEMHEDVVSDMFSQLNRRGKSLKPADLVNAYVSLRKFNLKKATREFETRLHEQGLASGRAPEDVLRIMLIDVHPQSDFKLQDDNYEHLFPGRPTSVPGGKTDILIKDEADFEKRYARAQDAYESGLLTLRDESHYGTRLSDTSGPGVFVPFEGILPVYCSLLALANGEPAWQKRVRQWYWASVLTERYYATSQESSNAARGSTDYNQVFAWFEDDAKKPVVIHDLEDKFGLSLFPQDKLAKPPGSSTPGLMQGIRGLLFMLRPRDWFASDQYTADDVTEVEIVSPQWCREQGLSEALARSVFNEILVNEETADAMLARSPRQNLEAIFDKRSAGEMSEILQSHCISQAGYDLLMSESFSNDDFETFLREREAEFLRRVAQELFDDLDLRLP